MFSIPMCGGQFYNGQVGKGFGFLIGAILGVFTLGIVTIVCYIWSIVDAYSSAEKINKLSSGSQVSNVFTSTSNTGYSYKPPVISTVYTNMTNKEIKEEKPVGIETAGNVSKEEQRYQSGNISASSLKEQIVKYKRLFDNGILNYTEYSENKENIIDEIKAKGIKESKEDFLLELTPLLKENTLNESDITRIKAILFNK